MNDVLPHGASHSNVMSGNGVLCCQENLVHCSCVKMGKSFEIFFEN